MTNRTKLLLPALFAAGIGIEAQAAEIPTNTAQMQAMDKITGRVSVINVPVNAEVKFGSFSVLVRDCRTRSPEETPENFAFVDVADTVNGNEQVNIFKGWMLSSSPALNAIEHPVYDVWLLKCIDTDISGVQTLTPDELAAIHERMAEAGISNAGAYVRKMALNGYILHVDLAPIKELISLQRRCSNNLNQVAVHAHTYGVYPEEIDGLKRDYEKLWGEVSKVLRELSELVAK